MDEVDESLTTMIWKYYKENLLIETRKLEDALKDYQTNNVLAINFHLIMSNVILQVFT